MSIILVSGLATTMIYVFDNNINQSRFQETKQELNQIKLALVGSPNIYENGVRKNFGYLGGVGALPTVAQGLSALVNRPASIPVWSINASARIGAGWNGPYLQDGISGVDYLKDAWGNDYIYSPGASPPTVTSLGADGAVGGDIFDQDIVISLPSETRLATVQGFIADGRNPFTGVAEAEINFPNGSGVLQQDTVMITALDSGAFQFIGVPFGVRSISVYIPNKTSPTSVIGPVIISIDKPHFLINL